MGTLLGLPMSHVVNLFERLERLGVTAGHLERVRNDRDYGAEVAKLIKTLDQKMAGKDYEITVDYSLTLKEMLEQCAGNHGVYHKNINEAHFPRPDRRDRVCKRLVVVNPHRRVTLYEGSEELERRGVAQATIEDLFSLGFTGLDYYDACLIALGTRWESVNPEEGLTQQYVVALGRTLSGDPHIWLHDTSSSFEGRYLFLGVKK